MKVEANTDLELNRDIRRLAKRYVASGHAATTEEWQAMKKEYVRLYRADTTMTSMNVKSLRIMIRLNLALQAVAFHHFGIYLEIEKEL